MRNLRIEMTPYRLVGMPLVLGLIFLAAHATAGMGAVDRVAHAGLILLLVVWATRPAAGAVSDEIENGTWDAQRMSALSPWSMTWGKLLGVTAFPWYGAAFCVLAERIAGRAAMGETLNLLLTALTAQGAAFFFGLLLQRGSRRGGLRTGLAMAQTAAILLALWLGSRDWYWSSEAVAWWTMTFDGRAFVIASQALALAWVLAGIHALIRAELRYPPQPWTWLAFLAFAAVYVAGFSDALLVTLWFQAMVAVQVVPLASALLTVSVLTVLSALLVPQSSVALRRWLAAPGPARGRPAATVTEAPAWVVGLAVCLVVAVAITFAWLRVPSPPWLPVLVWSGMLFLLRDLGILIALSLDNDPRRGPLSGMIYLLTVYMVVPLALSGALPDAAQAVRPTWGPSVAGSVLPAACQALFAWMLVAWRWRVAARGLSARKAD
jgi:hypothetical protein